jgi:uncharacterized protein (DUF362 family)
MKRRTWLAGGGLGAALHTAGCWREYRMKPEAVFIAKAEHYQAGLERIVHDALAACGLTPASVAGKHVLLKPNLIEPAHDAPWLTTGPAVVAAAAEVFRSWGAAVSVGEGPGHVRDTEMALAESGLADVLDRLRLPFHDLNYEETVFVPNRGRRSTIEGFHFPRSVAGADLVVSIPKAKTHHWVGVTVAMKNLYGTLPGTVYGWPKNVLHWAGIPRTVFDINASLPRTVAIVDAIDCMEGDGPIMGTPKHLGVLVVGTNLPAVDATVCRLMDLDPGGVPYLELASGRLGPTGESRIEQRGEPWQGLARPFTVLDRPHLRGLVRHRGRV